MTILNTLSGSTGFTINDLGAIVVGSHPSTLNFNDYGISDEEVLQSLDLKALIAAGRCELVLANRIKVNATNSSQYLGDSSVGLNKNFQELTADTTVAEGTYVLNSTGGSFEITLDDNAAPAEWFFISPYKIAETNNITIKADATDSFTDEDGELQQEELVVDSVGVIVNVITFDNANYVVTVSAIRATTPEEPDTNASTALTIVDEVSANVSAKVSELLPVNSTGGPITVSAPASPIANNRFGVVDSRGVANTNNIIIDFGSANFAGGSNDFVLNTQAASVTFSYINATIGWIKN